MHKNQTLPSNEIEYKMNEIKYLRIKHRNIILLSLSLLSL